MQTVDESMESVTEVSDWPELMALLREHYYFWEPTEENVLIQKWGQGIDTRIGWDTHVVTVNGHAALFTDGDLPKPEEVSRGGGEAG